MNHHCACAPGCRPFARVCRTSSGFTLIELLVVLVLIGVILSFAVLSIDSSGEREVELEAKRLHALLALAGEEAVLKSRETAVLFEPSGYRFMMLASDGINWAPLEDDVFRPRTLPAGFSLTLAVEGLPVVLDRPKEENKPQVFLLSSGERTPFEADVGILDGVRYRVAGAMLGDLTLKGPVSP